MRKDRMERIASFIESLPEERFDMDDWIETESEKGIICEKEANVCQTACCIAGWTVLEAGKCLDNRGKVFHKNGKEHKGLGNHVSYAYAGSFAKSFLDLTVSQADALFYQSDWPEAFKGADSNDTKIAAARIRHMIETGE